MSTITKLLRPPPPGREVQSIVMSMFVCPASVHISETTRPNFIKLSVDVACGRGSVLFRRCCCDTLCTSGFVHVVMFSRSVRHDRQLEQPD